MLGPIYYSFGQPGRAADVLTVYHLPYIRGPLCRGGGRSPYAKIVHARVEETRASHALVARKSDESASGYLASRVATNCEYGCAELAPGSHTGRDNRK